MYIVDPLGVLEQGQIYYRSSNSMINPETQTLFNVVKGEVLVCMIFAIVWLYANCHLRRLEGKVV